MHVTNLKKLVPLWFDLSVKMKADREADGGQPTLALTLALTLTLTLTLTSTLALTLTRRLRLDAGDVGLLRRRAKGGCQALRLAAVTD